MKKSLSSKYIWIAIAITITILTPIGGFLSLSGNNTAPPPPAANISNTNVQAKEVVQTGIYFPLFVPPGPLWDNMLIYRQAHQTLPWIAVVDPHHGPGEQYDANYAKNIEKLQAANVTVLGYVSTLWAGKSPDLVKEDISKYKDWYSVDGIMLDEMISDPGFEGLYSNYTKYAKSLGMRQVIGNVGTNISPTYAGTVDSIGTVEGDGTPPLSWLRGWQLNYDKSNFLYITYSQSWTDPEYIADSTKYVGLLYMTDDTMPFPYDDFPAYFDEVVAVLDPQGNNDLRTLSVRASDLRGNSLEGTFTTVSSSSTTTDGNTTITTIRTPLAHIGNVNSTYTVTALSNSTHTFDHWDDGSTNPSRIVALDSSKVLRAYYKTPSTSDLQSSIVVNALTTQGGQLGMWISILQRGADSGSGFTPVVAPAQEGMNYTVTANDHQNLVFDHWEDGSINRTKTIGLQQGSNNIYLTAYYLMEKGPSLVDLTVDAYTLDGTEIRGLWSVITPSGAAAIGGLTPLTHVATSGLTYAVEAQDHDIYTFDHWEDGSTNRTRTIALDSGTTLSAYYKTPPADLQINFVSLSGEEGLIGMNATVTAMGNSTTLGQQQITNSSMTYAGRLASVYTITASDHTDYLFDHWENGSTYKIRNVMLSSNNTEVIAYYSERRTTTTSSPSSSSQSQVTEGAAETTGTFVNSTFAEGLNIPTAMEFAPDGRLFIAEEGGNVRIIQKEGLLLDTPFLSVSTNTCCESGLLGITLDPNFASNGFVYVYYTVDADPMHNRVSRFTADPANPDMALAGSEQPILDLEPLAPNFHHGGAIHFGRDGKLYIGVGDNYIFENAQLLTTRLGKMLRINSDGSIPTDNPFYNTTGARKEIWALGLRNPFTFAFSPADGKMFINDVGHDWAEEINAGAAGANYGWPRCEGACLNPDYIDPVYAYTHEDMLRKAITGGAFYEADQFPAKYKGSYFFGDYVLGFIKRLTPDGQVVDFQDASSPVDIDVGADGSLYYLSLGTGEVRKIQYVKSE